jgi:hypothetical protein
MLRMKTISRGCAIACLYTIMIIQLFAVAIITASISKTLATIEYTLSTSYLFFIIFMFGISLSILSRMM